MALFFGAAIFVGCNKQEDNPIKKDDSVLYKKFGVLRITQNTLVDISDIKGIKSDFINKNLKSSKTLTASSVLYYEDGSKAYIFNSANPIEKYVIKVDPDNKFLADRNIILTNLKKLNNKLNFDLKIINPSSGDTCLFSVRNNIVINETVKKIQKREPGESFGDCFKRALATLTDDWIGIVAFTTNPYICLSACALSCA